MLGKIETNIHPLRNKNIGFTKSIERRFYSSYGDQPRFILPHIFRT